MTTIATLSVKLIGDSADFQKSMADSTTALDSFAGKMKSAGSSMTSAGTKLTVGVTAPLALLGRTAIQTAADFESQMNILSVSAGDAGTSMETLSDAAITIGSDTRLVGINASEAAGAMTNFYKAGLDTADIFGDLNQYLTEGTELSGAMRSAIDLQAASELDLAAASDLVAIAMATFGLDAEQAAGIADSFVQTADASVSSVQELADAMFNIGPTAAAFGMDMGVTNTALALLSERGIRGAEAGTALKSMLTNMMRDTPKVNEAWEELGVALYDAEGNLRSLPHVIVDLDSALSGLTEEQRNQYVQTLAGTYGMKALQTLLAEGKDGWNGMHEAINTAASAQEVATARTQGLSAAWENFQGVVETLMITVLMPFIQNTLTPFVQKLSEGVSWLQSLSPETQSLILIFLGVAAAAGPLLIIFGSLIGAIGTIAGAVSAVIPILGAVAGVITGPVLLAIGAVIAVIALLYVAWTENWGGIQDIVRGAVAYISNLIQTTIANIKAWWERHGDEVIARLQATWDTIQAVVRAALDFLRSVIEGFLAGVQAFWEDHGDSIMTIVNFLWETISSIVSTVAAVISDIVRTALEAIQRFWTAHGDEIIAAAESAWNFIQSIIEGVTEVIGTIIDAFALAVEGDWRGFGEKLREAWDQAWALIIEILNTAWDTISEIVSNLVASIVEFITTTDWIAVGDSIVKGIGAGMEAALDWIMGVARKVAAAALEAAKGFLGIESPSTVFIEVGEAIGEGLVEGIRSKFSDVEDAVHEMLDVAGDLGSIGSTFGNIFKDRTLNPLEEFIDKADKRIPAMATALAERLKKTGAFQDKTVEQVEKMLLDPKQANEIITWLTGQGVAMSPLRNKVADLVLLMRRRNKAEEEFIEQNERLLELEKQQQDLQFLQKQMDLLDLIAERGLDAGAILEGLELGLDADVGALMDAMARAMKAVIEQAEESLGIASPSKIFERIGRFVNIGLARGLEHTSPIERAMNAVTETAMKSFGDAASGRPDQSRVYQDNRKIEIYSNAASEPRVNNFGRVKTLARTPA